MCVSVCVCVCVCECVVCVCVVCVSMSNYFKQPLPSVMLIEGLSP